MTFRELLEQAAIAQRSLSWNETPTPEQAARLEREKQARRRALDEKTLTILHEYKRQSRKHQEKQYKHEKSGAEMPAKPARRDSPVSTIKAASEPHSGGQARRGGVLAYVAVTALALAALLGVRR